jgi:multidrug resistance efflux pump
VRLAQRIPVRVAIDAVPADLRLVAGQTATVQVLPAQARPAAVRAPAPAPALHAAASIPNKQ